jgi:plastocyanin
VTAYTGSRGAAALVLAVLLAACISDRWIADPVGDLAACVIPVDALARGDALVVIHRQAFVPDTLRLRSGRSVTWVNCEADGSEAHTSTADDGAWASPLLRAGDSWSVAFPAAGTHAYTCLPHPFMRAVVIVE